MKRYRVILDTNVVLAAMRSQTGASHRLLRTIGHPQWQSVVTPALMYEYEDVARRPGAAPGLSPQDVTNILNLIYRESHRQCVWFSWRPLSPDPGDDAILEAAIAGRCEFGYRSTKDTCEWRGNSGSGFSRPRNCSNW
jgi:predicted nucleic acid-binding protein